MSRIFFFEKKMKWEENSIRAYLVTSEAKYVVNPETEYQIKNLNIAEASIQRRLSIKQY